LACSETVKTLSAVFAPSRAAAIISDMESKFARIGRTYPRPTGAVATPAPIRRMPRRYRITGALIVFFSALGLLGWYLAR
jgi:hypothetical protein